MKKPTDARALRSLGALKREYARVTALRRKEPQNDPFMAGAQQALAWVMKDYAMAASDCFRKFIKP